ncbi:hypothetical protein [Acinetobacter sp.]|uniref:hypothetical protein n=1 Tax=Acinetobacter sp. TaxID=472 RepID=UPI0031E11205
MDSNNNSSKKADKPAVQWLNKPEDHDYPAAASYLNLILDSDSVKKLTADLQDAKVVTFKSKDLLRAAQLPLLDEHNYHVAHDLSKINQNKSLSPLLLVRDTKLRRLIIADGYHRLCAVYLYDEDTLIPCQIVSLNG